MPGMDRADRLVQKLFKPAEMQKFMTGEDSTPTTKVPPLEELQRDGLKTQDDVMKWMGKTVNENYRKGL